MNYRPLLAGALILFAGVLLLVETPAVASGLYDYRIVITGPFEHSYNSTIRCYNYTITVHVEPSGNASMFIVEVEGGTGNTTDQMRIAICVLEELADAEEVTWYASPLGEASESVTGGQAITLTTTKAADTTIIGTGAGTTQEASPGQYMHASGEAGGEESLLERMVFPVIAGLVVGVIVMALALRA